MISPFSFFFLCSSLVHNLVSHILISFSVPLLHSFTFSSQSRVKQNKPFIKIKKKLKLISSSPRVHNLFLFFHKENTRNFTVMCSRTSTNYNKFFKKQVVVVFWGKMLTPVTRELVIIQTVQQFKHKYDEQAFFSFFFFNLYFHWLHFSLFL